MKKLAIVIPMYNEKEVFSLCVDAISEVLNNLINKSKISKDSYMLLVDDGSKDNTWSLIEEAHKQNKFVYGLKLAANVGHQNALLAGLMTAKDNCDISVSIDADLQDDVKAIEKMVDKYLFEGCDVVYGVRSKRKTDTFFKRTTAQGFYKVMNSLGAKSVYNHADFRLLSNRALISLAGYKEQHLFLRGLVPLIGFKSDSVYYERTERAAGESKYPLKKMLKFAFNGITSFSTKPLSLITGLGILIIILSIAALIYTLVSYFLGVAEPGWSSLILSIWFLGGVQLFCIGLVGQYVGKIFEESKERPRYNIETFLNNKKQNGKENENV